MFWCFLLIIKFQKGTDYFESFSTRRIAKARLILTFVSGFHAKEIFRVVIWMNFCNELASVASLLGTLLVKLVEDVGGTNVLIGVPCSSCQI